MNWIRFFIRERKTSKLNASRLAWNGVSNSQFHRPCIHAKVEWRRGLLETFVVLTGMLMVASGTVLPAAASPEPQGQNILRATLANGLRLVIVRDNLAPVVTTVVNYMVGSNEAPPEFPGIAHAQEHMIFRGSPDLSADQLADITAAMGGNFDADTQQVITQYYFTVPAEDLDVALHVQSIGMRGVLDTDPLWNKERPAIEQEVAQDLSSPTYVFYAKLLAAMFQGTPYAHDALGTRPSFDKLTGDALHKFYGTWYAPNNAILVIVGNIDPPAVQAEVETLFSSIPAKHLPAKPQVNLEPVKPQSLQLNTDLPYGLGLISFRMPGSNSPDFAAAEVLADVLSSQRGSLYAMVPEGKALYAGFSLNGLPDASLGFALAAYPKGADGAGLIGQMRQILEDEVQHGVPPDLVKAAKLHELVDDEFQKNSVSGLAMAWSQAVAVESHSSPEDDVQAIEKVTTEDVNRVAKKYLAFDHTITAVLTPQPSGKPVSSKGFGGQESFAPKQTHPVVLPVWAAQDLNRLSIPSSTVTPVVTTLANGLKLIVQPERVSNTVSVYGRIKTNSDLETPPGQEGTSSMLAQLFSYGTTTLDRLAFQRALDAIGANESAGSGFSLEVMPGQFDQGVKLLAENELSPALPAPAFKILQRQLAAAVAGELQSPNFLMQQALHTALFPKNDPSLRHATPATVSSLTLEDVQNYYTRTFRPDLTTLVVIGNIQPDEARAVIEKYFGGWKAAGPKPVTDLQAVPFNHPSTTAVPDTSRVQDRVTLAETLGLNRFSPDYYALELGNHVLGGGFYATRFYKDLRENGGLVYYVSSSFNFGKTRGIYEVNYGCDPPNVSKARAIVMHDLKQMQTQSASSDELQQAKALLLREIPLAESSVDSIAGGLLSRAVIGLPLDEPVRAARRYVQLTTEDVRAAFAKWVRPTALVQVTEGPSPR
ncbi:MAG TPA: pitrilysin family protein [Terriglobia bacterium]|nr:pitrilysin family protein [Terriglobia bacterium]